MSESRHIEILNQLNSIFQEVFDDDQIKLEDETTAADVDGWDSLSNVRLLVHIEQELNINFNSSEIADVPNVGELVELILTKL